MYKYDDVPIPIKDFGDTWSCNLYGLPYPIYFYFYSRTQMVDEGYFDANLDSMPIGNCPALLSSQFAPYLDYNDFNTYSLHYDIKRFGTAPYRPEMTQTPFVHRITAIKPTGRIKTLGRFDTYLDRGRDVGKDKPRNWKNESRLLNYPYSFGILTDGISPPFQVKYHLCPNNVQTTVKVRNTLSDRCSYGLFIDGYKNDNGGAMEGIVSGDGHELPCSSSAYNQWYASSKNSTAQGVSAVSQQAFLSSSQASQMASLQNRNSYQSQAFGQSTAMLSGIAGGIAGGGGILGKIGGGIAGGVSGAINSTGIGIQASQQRQVNSLNAKFAGQQASLDKKSAIQGALSQVKDLNNTPNTMLSMGSDFIYGFNKQGSALKIFRFGVSETYAKSLGDYFALYGYKQNKIMSLKSQLRTRYYYNYIKTIGANIKGNGAIAKEHLETIKAIFDKGVTIWHITREGVEVGNYSKDNVEV